MPVEHSGDGKMVRGGVPPLPTTPIVRMCAALLPSQPEWRWTACPTAARPEIATVTEAEPPIRLTVTEPLPPRANVWLAGAGAWAAVAAGAGATGGGGGTRRGGGGAGVGRRGRAGLAPAVGP